MGSKSGGTSVQKSNNESHTNVDQQTQDYMRQVMEAARRAGASGPSPLTTGASDYYGGMMSGGNLGMSVLKGDPTATQSLMNPYQQQVINATNSQWDRNDQNTMNTVNDAATKAGAFGGSRHGVATGVALGENNTNRNNAVSGLLYGGFNDTMSRANQLANLGFQGAGQNANLGMGGIGNPDQWMMEMLKRGYMGPMGTSTGGSTTSFGANTSGKFGF